MTNAETVEIELTPTVATALAELEAEYGEVVVQSDLQQAVSQAIVNGYRRSQSKQQSSQTATQSLTLDASQQ